MKLGECLFGTAIYYVLLGLGFLFIPLSMLGYLGIGLTADAEMLARIIGAGLLGLAVIYYFMRKADMATAMPLVNAAVLSNALAVVVLVMGIMAGNAGTLAWLLVVLSALIVLAFAYLGYLKKAA